MLSKLLLVLFWKSSLSYFIFKIRLFWWWWKVSAWAHLWFAAHMFAFVGGFNLPPHINPTSILVYDNLEWDSLCDTLFPWCLPVDVTPFFQERHLEILLKWTGDVDAIILKTASNSRLAQIFSVAPNVPPTVIPSDDRKRGERVRWACRCNTIPPDRCRVMSAQRGALAALCQKTCWCCVLFFLLVWVTIICLYILSLGQTYGG